MLLQKGRAGDTRVRLPGLHLFAALLLSEHVSLLQDKAQSGKNESSKASSVSKNGKRDRVSIYLAPTVCKHEVFTHSLCQILTEILGEILILLMVCI